ncbi:MAG: DUF4198 domain-containing protein [Comamonas sp.]
MKMMNAWGRRTLSMALISGSLLFAASAQAHNVWLEPDAQGGYLIQFGGHEGKLESFDPAKLQSVKAYDLRGREIATQVEQAGSGLRVLPAPKAAMIAVELDNGYFSGPATGPMKNVPMDQNPGSERGVHALKFHKTIIVWNGLTQRDLGQQFEVTPLQGKTPHAGDWLELKVQLNGHPLQGARVSVGEKGTPAITDAKGLVKVQVQKGTNYIQAIFRQPIEGDPKTTQRSYEALVSFAAH